MGMGKGRIGSLVAELEVREPGVILGGEVRKAADERALVAGGKPGRSPGGDGCG